MLADEPSFALSAILPLVLLAPIMGSFLGVLIRRLPVSQPVALSRSICESCGTRLTVRDLIPLVSYLIQRGRCRHCGARIAPFHLAVELAAIGVVLVAAAVEPDSGSLWPGSLWIDCLLGWTLLALAWIDWQWLRLPDVLTLPLLLAGLGVTLWQQPDSIAEHAVAAIVAYASLQAIAIAYRRLRGRDGLGAGDAKLLAAAGAWLGLAPLPWVLLLAATAGLLAALAWALAGRRIDGATALPFGPWLALAFWILWLYRDVFDGLT
jgi:leader peptidase (prepilin peptidase)/N-methyltransferase